MTRSSLAGRTGGGMYGGYYDIVWLDPDGRERKDTSGNTSKQRAFAKAKQLVETGDAIWSEVRTDSNSSRPVEVLIRFRRSMPAKKTAAQLNRDIAEVLAKPPRGHAAKKTAAPKIDRRRIKYVSLSWTWPESVQPDPSRRYQEGNYPDTDIPKMLDQLRANGVTTAFVDDKEVTL